MFVIDVVSSFESLVTDIMIAEGFEVEGVNVRGADSGREVDLNVRFNGREYICEVKAYRTRLAQLSLIFTAASRLHMMCDEFMLPGILIVSSKIDTKIQSAIKDKFNILVVDIEDLYLWGAKAGGLSDALVSLFSIDSSEVETFKGRDALELIVEDCNKESNNDQSRNKSDYNEGQNIIDEITSIKVGRNNWRKYEDVCSKALEYLFKEQLQGWHKQMTTTDGLNRYDYVCKISGANSFWSFLINEIKSRYIVFEFKNYSKKITQFQIVTTEKYLLENALRKVAIVLCRKGGDTNAIRMTQGAMRESGKLIIILNDEDLIGMLNSRMRGGDASDYLWGKTDDFLLKLPR